MLTKDEWLSQYFDHGVYRYDVPYEIQDFPKGFVYSKVPLEKISEANRLMQNGFKVVEVMVQFEQKRLVPNEWRTDIQIEFSKPEDRNPVAKIAQESFVFSRFCQDEEISKITAHQIKTDWVSNYFKGKRGDNMIVAREKGSVIGFMLLMERSIIDLIAVSSAHTGQGIASAMIDYANQHVGLLRAGTQLINKPSIALYEKSGFFIKNANYILHRHIK